MKTIKFLTTALTICLFITSCKNDGKTKTEEKKIDPSIAKIEVIDFHSTNRCMTCNAIEANTKYTLDTFFSDELKDGKITFKIINVDKAENEKIAENFEATGTSLFLNVIKNGKEKHIDLTNFAFANGRNQDEFSKELKVKINEELKNL